MSENADLKCYAWGFVSGKVHQERKNLFSTGIRTLPFLLLEWPTQGEWQLTTSEEVNILIRPGEILCIPPGQRHCLTAQGYVRSNWAFFSTSGAFGHPLMSACSMPPHILGTKAKQLCRELAKLVRGKPIQPPLLLAVSQRIQELKILELLIAVGPKAFTELPFCDGRTDAALDWIQQHYTEQITRKDIAESMHLSLSRAHELFKVSTGLSPLEYVLRVRLREAQKKLLLTQSNVKEIAFACGFESAPYFTRFFRQRLGCSPSQYRDGIRTMQGY